MNTVFACTWRHDSTLFTISSAIKLVLSSKCSPYNYLLTFLNGWRLQQPMHLQLFHCTSYHNSDLVMHAMHHHLRTKSSIEGLRDAKLWKLSKYVIGDIQTMVTLTQHYPTSYTLEIGTLIETLYTQSPPSMQYTQYRVHQNFQEHSGIT